MRDWLTNLVVSLSAVFLPVKEILLVVGVLIVADFVTGIAASRKKKTPITSAGFKRSVVKMLVYQTAVLTGFLVEAYLLKHSLPVTNIVAGVIGLTEFKSVLENLHVVNGGSVATDILEKLGSKKNADSSSEDSKHS